MTTDTLPDVVDKVLTLEAFGFGTVTSLKYRLNKNKVVYDYIILMHILRKYSSLSSWELQFEPRQSP